MRKWLLIISFIVLGGSPAAAQDHPLDIEVITTSVGSLYANISLIKGEEKAVLVDAPFTLARVGPGATGVGSGRDM